MTDTDTDALACQSTHGTAGGVRPMQTVRSDVLMDLLSAPASGLLFLREFAINGCEAIGAGTNDSGTVLFDVDWRQLASSGIARLTVIDDGVGMSPYELVRYIGNLSSSGKDHRVGANHGVGCKIAGARASPRGVEFRSWRDGVGWMVVLCQHASGTWGLRELRPHAEGDERYLLALNDEDRPALLGGSRPKDGTQVTFLGNAADEHTYFPPPAVTEGRSLWIRRYLNDRLYEIPDGVTIMVRENVLLPTARDGRAAPCSEGVVREVIGARASLQAHSEWAGVVRLSDARCHCWVLRKARGRGRPVAREWAATGSFGLLHRGEIFDSQKGMHGGQQGLSSLFKVRLGADRVVLLVEPDDAEAVTPDIARMTLTVDGQPLPWVRWGHEFAALMPAPIKALQRSLIDDPGSERRRRRSVTARWTRVSGPIVALLHVPPRPRIREPRTSARESAVARASRPPATTAQPAIGSDSASSIDPPGRKALVATPHRSAAPDGHRMQDRRGEPRDDALRAMAVTLRYPTTLWLPAGEVPDDLHNKAARYDPGDDVLTISPEFPVYLAQLDRLLEDYGGDPEAGAIITEKLRQWWELTLVEAVDMARRLAADDRELEQLTSPWSLSTTMSALSPIAQHLRREVPLQLGRQGPLSRQSGVPGAADDDARR